MPEEIASFFRIIALTLAALLPIINPPGGAPVFLSMTPGLSEETRTALAAKIATNSFALLVAAMLIGSYVLSFFGLSLAVVRIAGGLLVIASGWRLVRTDDSPTTEVQPASWDADRIARQSFYPLTFPLTIGPGSVSVAITLGASTHAAGQQLFASVTATLLGVLIASVAIYFSFRYASRLLRALGATGSVVLLRLSAFILLAVGVQIFCDGLAQRFAVFSGVPTG